MTEFLAILPYIIVFAILIIGIICLVLNQKKSVKEWLLLAVIEAEKLFGEKTGKLKLRQVFESFVKLYPIFSKFVTFDTFSGWVDIALKQMEEWLSSNKVAAEYVNSTKTENLTEASKSTSGE